MLSLKRTTASRKPAKKRVMATNPARDIRKIMLETASMQLATLNAGIMFWSQWVQYATRYAEAAKRELAAMEGKSANANELLARLTDSSREYMRDLAGIPDRVKSQFNAELKKSRAAAREYRRTFKVKR